MFSVLPMSKPSGEGLSGRQIDWEKWMFSTRVGGLAVAVVGGVFLALGVSAADAPLAELRHGLTGQYSDRTMLQIVGGSAALVIGSLVALRARS
ncbi:MULTISPECIES: DUF3185 family protein [Thalassobaculum]|uniref:DUF3185 family protein n=1 Tax=Thalassobaculum litoreum DSM 18839 TaxID=1123362 RepID=A0A8G2BGU2_9PROT|nr:MULTISPECIES: DUF3185 family protein [Thalassobaculum]SDF62764.1 Protein of unknown function [Thalassobaculum litoreum DSM 18839]